MANKRTSSTATRAKATRSNARRSNNMTNNRDKRFIALVVLLAVALVTMIGIAVAATSTNLNIAGTATVKALNWDVHFDSISAAIINSTNNTAVEKTAPKINNTDNTLIDNYDVVLRHPGDSIAYEIVVVNDGDVDAKITGIKMAGIGTDKLACASTAGTQAEKDARNAAVCQHLNYTLEYKDGTTVAKDDVLTAGAQKTLVLKLEYSTASDGTSYYPDDDVSVSDLDVVVTYGQK